MSNSLAQWFGFNRTVQTDELPELFPLPIVQGTFVETDIVAIYSKILTDVLERTHGLSEDQVELMWDSCLMSSSSEGLVTRLAKAMAARADLFLVYEKAVGIVRLATSQEQSQIRQDYQKKGESSVGVYVSFKNFSRSEMVKFYLGMEYLTVGSLYKSMNLSKAVQVKISDLRASVSLADAADAKTQGKAVATALSKGRDVLLDVKDSIETSKPDLTAVQEAVKFVVQKLSFYLGMPDSYLSGEQTAGMGTTGENDMRAVERGLKAYYFAIVKPVLEALFGAKLSYKSQDTRQILGAMEVIKTFGLVDEELISLENKTKIVNQLLGLDEDAEGDPAPPAPKALPAPAATPKPDPAE